MSKKIKLYLTISSFLYISFLSFSFINFLHETNKTLYILVFILLLITIIGSYKIWHTFTKGDYSGLKDDFFGTFEISGSFITLISFNVLGFLFNYNYILGYVNDDPKRLLLSKQVTYEKGNKIDLLQKGLCLNFDNNELEDLIDKQKKYYDNKLHKTSGRYPLKIEDFKFTKGDSLLSLIINKRNVQESPSIFLDWMNYLTRYGHYEKALIVSNKIDSTLLSNTEFAKALNNYLDGIISYKEYQKIGNHANLWFFTYAEAIEFQVFYYYFKKNKFQTCYLLDKLNRIEKSISDRHEDIYLYCIKTDTN